VTVTVDGHSRTRHWHGHGDRRAVTVTLGPARPGSAASAAPAPGRLAGRLALAPAKPAGGGWQGGRPSSWRRRPPGPLPEGLPVQWARASECSPASSTTLSNLNGRGTGTGNLNDQRFWRDCPKAFMWGDSDLLLG
jgi:hypothetical protein